MNWKFNFELKKLIHRFSLFLIAFSFLTTIAYSQPQKVNQSPQINHKYKNSQNQKDDSSDISDILEIDDPLEAAEVLRNKLKSKTVKSERRQAIKAFGVSKRSDRRIKRNTIPLFNGRVLKPEPLKKGEAVELKKRQSLKRDYTQDTKITALLQFSEEMDQEDVLDLLEANVKIFEPIGNGAIIIRAYESTIEELKSRDYVVWIGEYKPEYKFNSVPSESSKQSAFLYILGGDKSEYRYDLEAAGIKIIHYDSTLKCYEVTLDASEFHSLAESFWWIKGILKEPEEIAEAMTDVSVNFEPNDSRELIMSYDSDYKGDKVTIGVRDDGIYHNHDQLKSIFHSDSELDKVNTHGTHVTGIIAGRLKTIQGPWDETTVRGVAPDAEILFRFSDFNWVDQIFNPDLVGSYLFDFGAFKDNSVQISNHSYKIPNMIFGDYMYDSHTENFDAYCDNDDMVIIKSAGNYYNQKTISSPGTGKNVIAVGSIWHHSELIGKRVDYSSQGPTADDDRLKPEIVAPGGGSSHLGGIVSTSSDPWKTKYRSGNIDGNYNEYEWESDDNYLRLSGTSMAAPHVTGICAKIKDWKPDIHSELLKALLINTTIPLKNNSDDALAGYATIELGYGMANAFSPTTQYNGESERLLFAEGWLTEDDNPLYHEYTIAIKADTKKLIVTMAYNDQEGENSNDDALKDDLDLILVSPSGSETKAHEHLAANVTNQSPLEKTVIEDPEEGEWTVKVQLTDTIGNWNPLIFGEQRYGLVAHAIYKTPELTLDIPSTTFIAAPNQEFFIQPTITNTGGYIAAGVTVRADDSNRKFWDRGDVDKTRYVGNLLYEGDSISPKIKIVAPPDEGTYTLELQADGINHDFKDSTVYPKTMNVEVIVRNDTPIVNTMPDGGTSELAYTWVNNPLTIWGNVKAVSGKTYDYEWDIDSDGKAEDFGIVSDPKDIKFVHTYTSAGDYRATLTVKETGTHLTGTSTVRIKVLPAVTQTAKINLAIEKGLKWLYLKQGSNGSIYSYNIYGSAGAETASAVLAFENRGHKPCTKDLDNDSDVDADDRAIWEKNNIYAETVHKGLDYTISTLRAVSIGNQGAGNPDSNGNGIGIADSYGNRQPYKIGTYMMALVGAGDPASGAPNLIATTGGTNINGRTYKDIVQDMVDWCAYAQVEPNRGGQRGGWRYGPNYYSSDNSACQWPAIGMEAAEFGWGCTVPGFVKSENELWTNFSQYFGRTDSYEGAFGYTGKGTGAARTAAGMCQLNFQGKPRDHARIQAAAKRMNVDRGTGNGYAMYALAKAARISKIDTNADDIGDTYSEIELMSGWDWYEDYSNNLIATQRGDGSWYNSYHYVFSTSWAVEILTKNVFTLRPVADLVAVPASSPANSPVDFDISKSFHQDSSKTLVDWWLDVDNNGTFDVQGSFPVTDIVATAEYEDKGADYTASARLRISDNSTPVEVAEKIISIHITSGNVEPVADPGGPYEGVIGAPITFDGSASYDPNEGEPLNDTIVSYEWDLDGDGAFDDASGKTVQKVWDSAYQGYIGLRVTDSFGKTNTSTAYTQVFVVDLFPENYVLVNRKRINRYVIEYEYQFDMKNRGNATASNVMCTIDSVPAQVTLVDPEASFGTIAANTVVTSGDTFKFRMDRRYPVADFQIRWKLEYDDVGGDHISFVDFPLR